MDVELFLIADYANITDRSKLNVIGIFSEIHASAFPARHLEMQVIAKLSAGPGEFGTTRKLTIKLLNEDATETLVNWSREVEVPQGKAGHRVHINQILKLREVVFPQPGTYQFSVLVDQDEKLASPLFVVQDSPTEG